MNDAEDRVTLNLRQLRSFVVLADFRAFSLAAQLLDISQSSLTRHIQLLEEAVGDRLLDRRARPLGLTRVGAAFLPEARRILIAHDEALARLNGGVDEVVVGVSDELDPSVARTLAEVLRGAGVAVRVVVGRSRELGDARAAGNLDIAVVLSHGDELGGREVGRLGLRWIAYPEALADIGRGEPIRLVVSPDATPRRQHAERLLVHDGYAFRVVGTGWVGASLLPAIRAVGGVALLPTVGLPRDGWATVPDLPAPGSVVAKAMFHPRLPTRLRSTAARTIVAVLDGLVAQDAAVASAATAPPTAQPGTASTSDRA